MPKNPNLAKFNDRRLAAASSWTGTPFRHLHLAWCLLRGRTIDQIEAKTSNPHHFPAPSTIADLALQGYRPFDPLFYGVMTEEEYKAEKAAFHAKIITDLTAWKKQLSLTHLTIEATRRQRNAVKRSTPRTHQPRPASLPERAQRVA